MASIKAGLARLNPKSLAQFTRNVLQKMTGNANFSDPQPALADVAAKLAELEGLITAAESDGTKQDRLERDESAKELKSMMRILSNYVAMASGGKGSIIVSAGFELRKENEPTPPVTAPTALAAVRSSKSGVVELNWAPSAFAVSYEIVSSTTDPKVEDPNWKQRGLTTKSKFIVRGLVPGQYYYFRVKALGTSDVSAYSDPAMVMAA